MVPVMEPEASPDRRSVVTLGALTVLGAGTLAACGSSSGTGATSVKPGGVVVALSAVPVGGSAPANGPDGPIVVAQPTAGQVVAHSAICTHQGCQVAPEGKILGCPCHGSMFDAFTGAVLQGPAAAPLPAVAVKISGQDVVAG
jgi:cytochrome b6-f complex iron-sulfur subunit